MLLAACGPSDLVGEKKLKPIKNGMTLTEVAGVMGDGPLKPSQPADSLRLFHGFRTQVFLAQGERYQVLWYREKAGSIEEAITREVETPILVHADTVMGKGWAFYDETASLLNLPNPYRSKDRLDSISKAQLAPKRN